MSPLARLARMYAVKNVKVESQRSFVIKWLHKLISSIFYSADRARSSCLTQPYAVRNGSPRAQRDRAWRSSRRHATSTVGYSAEFPLTWASVSADRSRWWNRAATVRSKSRAFEFKVFFSNGPRFYLARPVFLATAAYTGTGRSRPAGPGSGRHWLTGTRPGSTSSRPSTSAATSARERGVNCRAEIRFQ